MDERKSLSDDDIVTSVPGETRARQLAADTDSDDQDTTDSDDSDSDADADDAS